LVSDRLNFLASRENTVIDNPYHNSHIARVYNMTRENFDSRRNNNLPEAIQDVDPARSQ